MAWKMEAYCLVMVKMTTQFSEEDSERSVAMECMLTHFTSSSFEDAL